MFSDKHSDETVKTSVTLLHSNVHETKSVESNSVSSSQNESVVAKLKQRAEKNQNLQRVGNQKGESKSSSRGARNLRHQPKLNDGNAKLPKETKPKTRKQTNDDKTTNERPLFHKQNSTFKYDGYTVAYLARQKKLSEITGSDFSIKK